MRTLNAFKITNGKIDYTDAVKAAVLDPKITLKLNMNGGWDWIDQRYGFIKLLLSRGQIAELTTHQDLLACSDYLDAAKLGVSRCYGLSIHFEFKPMGPKGKGAFASEKRMVKAKGKWVSFCTGGNQ